MKDETPQPKQATERKDLTIDLFKIIANMVKPLTPEENEN